MSKLKEKSLALDTVALTDTGMVRANNEDNLFTLDTTEIAVAGLSSCGIYLVADGMGGHQGGEVASDMAVKIIPDFLKERLKSAEKLLDPDKLIGQAIQKANQAIYDAALDTPDLFTMGTTVTLGFRLDNRLFIGHVGDSRAYLVRKNRIRQLTEDHSLVARLLQERVITPEEAKNHPDRNKIYRCLGVSPRIGIDSYRQVSGKKWLPLEVGDILLFCSDGLSGYVSDEEILNCLLKADGAESACQELIRLANLKGGEDNISVIVVRAITVTGERRLPALKPDRQITRKRPQELSTH